MHATVRDELEDGSLLFHSFLYQISVPQQTIGLMKYPEKKNS